MIQAGLAGKIEKFRPLPQPIRLQDSQNSARSRGDGERCVTPARAAAKETSGSTNSEGTVRSLNTLSLMVSLLCEVRR